MSKFLDELSKEDRRQLRAEMQKHAEIALKGRGMNRAKIKAAARKMVDAAWAKEKVAQ